MHNVEEYTEAGLSFESPLSKERLYFNDLGEAERVGLLHLGAALELYGNEEEFVVVQQVLEYNKLWDKEEDYVDIVELSATFEMRQPKRRIIKAGE
jgi:hypothetical protein